MWCNTAILVAVSGSYGQQGDLRQWRNLQQNEEEYLVQISPPGDLLPEMIRTLVSNQNITNAAIIFDDTFGKSFSVSNNLKKTHFWVDYFLQLWIINTKPYFRTSQPDI